MARREQASRECWAAMDDEGRKALIEVTRSILDRLSRHPDQWLPLALDPGADHRLDLAISLEIRAEQVRPQMEMVAAATATREMNKRLEEQLRGS